MSEPINHQSDNAPKYTTTVVLKSKISADLGFCRSPSFTKAVIDENLIERYNNETGGNWDIPRFIKARLLPPGLANFIHKNM